MRRSYARDPNLAALRLSWWRARHHRRRAARRGGWQSGRTCASCGDRRLRSADSLARGDAGCATAGDCAAGRRNFATFRAFADESEGARLRLAARIAAGGNDLDEADAYAAAGMTPALTRMLGQLLFKAGAATPTPFPADIAARHGASAPDFDARHASPSVIAACAELRALARERACRGGAPVESVAAGDSAGFRSARSVASRS